MSEYEQCFPGLVILFGSGETSPSGRKIFEEVFKNLSVNPCVAILETPAGFELNSSQVAGRVGDFLERHLKNYQPEISILPARKRGTSLSPDNPEVVAPLWEADLVFMGPGSPTYTVNQLRDSFAWQILQARHRLGMSIALASAATIAIGAYAIPVYEIYKVGEDIYWKEGLNLFRPYGLSLVFVPHWNNKDGGDELDTSRCFMGKARFDPLMEILPNDVTVVGIDERTGLLFDLVNQVCQVIGPGEVTLLIQGKVKSFKSGMTFAFTDLGDFRYPQPAEGISREVWDKAVIKQKSRESPASPPEKILILVKERELARSCENWQLADELREKILEMGWRVLDTEDGPVIKVVNG